MAIPTAQITPMIVSARCLAFRVMEAITKAAAEEDHLLIHQDLFVLFRYLVGEFPSSKAKLTKRLGHAHIPVKVQTVGSKSFRGYKVKWKACAEDIAKWSEMLDLKTAESSLRVVS